MATLTIRLSDADRATLEAQAASRGEGISTLVRDLAEAEARRLRRAATRQQVIEFAALTDADPALAAEVEAMTDADPDWPGWEPDLPAAWLEQAGLP